MRQKVNRRPARYQRADGGTAEQGGQPSHVPYHALRGPASSLLVARASAAMLANAMIDYRHDLEAAGVGIGERLGQIIVVAQAIYGELGRLPELEAIA